MKMGNKKNVPEVRFKGFSEEWDKQELGDCADIVGGGTPSTNIREYWNGDIDWYSPVEIGKKIFVDGSQMKITELGLKNSSAKVLPVGTVLFSSRAGIGSTAILAKTGTTNQGFQSIIPYKNELDTYFIFSRSGELKQYGEKTGAGSTFVEVSGKQMAKMPISIPKIDEQIAIGNYFQNIDKLIITNQSKLNKLKNIKKAYLEKMFPKKGASVPEIRFKGFTEKWDKKRLNNIAKEFNGGGTPRTSVNEYWDGDIPWIQSSDLKENKVFGLVPQKFISKKGIKESATKLIPKNSVAVITRVGVGKLSLIPFEYATSQDFISISKLIIDELYAVYVISEKLQTILNEVQGTSIKGITKEELLSKEIMTPKTIEEQIYIGSFFKNLDDLINKTEHQLTKLKNIKKACLEKMFVNTENTI